jgi:small subunit ribosomal protein S17
MSDSEEKTTVAAVADPRNLRKVRQGVVYSSKMDKTITVLVENRKRHPMYSKIMTTTTKLKAHDANNEAAEGDLVEIMETRPLSKTKRWRLVRIVEKKK